MKPNYVPLSEIGDGDFVLVNWPYDRSVGLTGTVNESPAVMVLVSQLDNVPGPFTIVDTDGEFSAVTFGNDWKFDFDPLSADFEGMQRPNLGTLTITDRGPAVNGHNREMSRHAINKSGEFTRSGGAGPVVEEWRIVIESATGEYWELFRWPVPQEQDQAI